MPMPRGTSVSPLGGRLKPVLRAMGALLPLHLLLSGAAAILK